MGKAIVPDLVTPERRISALRAAKVKTNLEKQVPTGALNSDDLAFILPPQFRRLGVGRIISEG